MAVGTPYVASSLREIDRITDDAHAGFAVDNDPEAVAAAISRLAEDETLAEEMGDRGVTFIEREHRWPVLAERVTEVLRSVETASDRNSNRAGLPRSVSNETRPKLPVREQWKPKLDVRSPVGEKP